MAAGNKPIDFTAFRSRLRVEGVLHTVTALRIGSGGESGSGVHL